MNFLIFMGCFTLLRNKYLSYYTGANDSDDGLAAFARATAPRTERLKQRYGQESQPVSSDDEHDDYGNKNLFNQFLFI